MDKEKKPPIDHAVEEKIIEIVEAHEAEAPAKIIEDKVKRDKDIGGMISDQIKEAQIPQLDNVASTTTAEEDRQSKGQRDIKHTQSFLAIFVVVTALLVSAAVVIMATIFRVMGIATVLDSLALAAFTSLSSLASLVIGFYFGSKLASNDNK